MYPERREERYLCSHLVRLYRSGCSTPPETAVLEEIFARGAVLSTHRSYEHGVGVLIEAEGWLAPAAVAACCKRAESYELEVGFANDFVWHRTSWEPDHLYALDTAAGKARTTRGSA